MGGLAVVQNFAQFMVHYLIATVGSRLCGMLTLMTVIVNWFVRLRSRALALMQLGISIGSLALLAVAWALVTVGWRTVIAASGLIVLAVGLALSRLLDRDPEVVGLLTDGTPTRVPDESAGRPAATHRRLPQGPVGGALRKGAYLDRCERARCDHGHHCRRERPLRGLHDRDARPTPQTAAVFR